LSVRLDNIYKSFKVKSGVVSVLKGVNLNVSKGQFVAVLAPSGEGKTTILRIIAGLETQDKGDIYINDRLVNGVPPKDRNVAMVFQNYAIYPFMSVFDNIAFPLKIKHESKEEIKKKVLQVSQMLRIEDLLDRKPHQLSGGQRQRVAIARALVKGSNILLMDEPLANLDTQVRAIARAELKNLHNELGITVIYVTHDQSEAMVLADKVALLHDGVIQAFDDPLVLYKNPPTTWVASFIGNPVMNLIKGTINGCSFEFENYKIDLSENQCKSLPKEVVMGVRPEDIDIGGNIKGKLVTIENIGVYTILHLEVGNTLIKVIERSISKRNIGEIIDISISPDTVYFFDANTGKRLT